MPKARLLKDWFNGRERFKKGEVADVSEDALAYDERRTEERAKDKKRDPRAPLFERLAEPKPAPVAAKAAPAAVKPAAAPAKAADKPIA